MTNRFTQTHAHAHTQINNNKQKHRLIHVGRPLSLLLLLCFVVVDNFGSFIDKRASCAVHMVNIEFLCVFYIHNLDNNGTSGGCYIHQILREKERTTNVSRNRPIKLHGMNWKKCWSFCVCIIDHVKLSRLFGGIMSSILMENYNIQLSTAPQVIDTPMICDGSTTWM